MFSMKDVCQAVGMSYETLKYYCNEGLIPNVKRNEQNYRVFDEHDLAWIKSLSCLKRCGMSIVEMKQYVDLCLLGKSSIPERNVILNKKKAVLWMKRKEIDDCLAYIDEKQTFYEDVVQGRIEYSSNLIKIEETPGKVSS